MKIDKEIKSSFQDNHHKAYINLIYTANEVGTLTKKLFKTVDITLQQYNVLRILRGNSPKPLNPGAIKAVMLDKSPDLTRLIDRLLLKKLVVRDTCEKNRRKIDIKITKEGLALLTQLDPLVKKKQEQITEKLTDEEACQLSDLLDKLRGE